MFEINVKKINQLIRNGHGTVFWSSRELMISVRHTLLNIYLNL